MVGKKGVGEEWGARFENRETRFVVGTHSRTHFHIMVENGENMIGYWG
jgi:hypothetical protein